MEFNTKLTVKNIQKIKCSWRSVYLITFNESLPFVPGDSLAIFAQNSRNKIKKIASLFKWTVTDELNDVDLDLFPRRSLLRDIKEHCSNKSALNQLLKDVRVYNEHVIKYNLEDIVRLFDIDQVPIETFLKHSDRIKPRNYTLINKSGESMKILVGIISKNNKLGHISELVENNEMNQVKMSGFIRKNKLLEKLQMTHFDREFVMICTGVGIAPFIAFDVNCTLNNPTVIYGYRNNDDNLINIFDINKDTLIVECKSSDGKRVTDSIDILRDRDVNVFICGNIKMQRDVFNRIMLVNRKLVDQKQVYFDSWM
ncbi:hypothetical protein ECANGB1_40 [Enterospora canceri]|uniref:NADPH--hemoprotein reductase n=1 Tax=Enterospora canceri TaxID=1081671 RepID=A0A1Y1S9L5_9MICR|nr:hypothetical protein ECANGB1_40 [Enterospora canceri]